MTQDQSYESLLDELRIAMPDIAAALDRAHVNRVTQVSTMLGDSRLVGLQALIQFLQTLLGKTAKNENICRIAFLIERVIANYEMAIEAYLSGMNTVVFDAMRDVLEIQYLITDFTHDHARIDLWLSADPDTLRKKFSANTLRTREAIRQGIEPKHLATSVDYKGHSQFLHVSPFQHPFGSRGVLADRSFSEYSSPFWDMYRHGRHIIADLIELLLSVTKLDAEEDVFSESEMEPVIFFQTVSNEVERQETEFFSQVLGPDYKRGPDLSSP